VLWHCALCHGAVFLCHGTVTGAVEQCMGAVALCMGATVLCIMLHVVHGTTSLSVSQQWSLLCNIDTLKK